ncbi:MAG: phage tail tape measure protein [Prevotella sp.]|nr:phage tail tape measure protein [Prevotella sp.]
MAKNERYVTTIELNSQQATNRLKELEQKVKDLKKAKEDAAKSGGFFDEKELKKAVREFNQLNGQIKGIHGILENIDDMSLSGLQKAVRELKRQAANMLPDSEEWRNNQQQVLVLEDRIKQLKNSFRESSEQAKALSENTQNLSKVVNNIKSASLNELMSAQKYIEEELAKGQEPVLKNIRTDQLKEIKARIQEIKAEQQVTVTLMDKYDAEIKKVNKDINVTARETDLVDKTMHNLSKANVRDLEYSIKIVNERLRELPRGTQEFERMQEQAKKLRTELERVRYESAAQQGTLSRMADFFNKVQGTVIVGLSSITGLTLTVRRAIQAFADMDQEMENVRKYTGQTTEQVHEMNEEFKRLDTRTSRERLNQLAGDAGRLGIQGKEAIMDFVDAADKINVALGDDLGDGAVKNIGKLAMSFGTDKKMGLRGAMLATGSAVNELSQNSSAAANYLVDFTARVAGFGKQVGLTQTQLMGFGAVMDENMLRDEMAATAFGQLLVKMTTDIDTFARITGKTSEEFKKMVTEDINGAILTVARSLKGRDMQDLGKVFDAMNLDGQRAIGVLATLGDKVDDVAERQRIANEAFRKGTSITEEFNIQNTTVQAGLEKAKKQFNDLRVELGEKLLPIARYGMTTASAVIKILSELANFIGKFKYTIAILSTTIAYLVLKKEADVAVTKLGVFWNTKLAVAVEKLLVVMKKNPWTALATGALLAVGAIADLVTKSKEAAEATDKLNRVRTEAAKKYGEEKSKLDLLLVTARNENASLVNRKKAIDELNRIIPNYNGQLNETTKKYVENKEALDKYLQSLAKKFELEGAGEMLKDIGGDIAKASVEIEKLREKLGDDKNINMLRGINKTIVGDNETKQLLKQFDEQNRIIEDAGKQRQAIYKKYPELTGIVVEDMEDRANRHLQEILNRHKEKENKPDPIINPEAEDKARKAAETAAKKLEAQQKKELKERNDAIKAQTEQELAIVMNRYAKGEIDYRKYISEIDRIQLDGFNKRLAIYNEESDEYKKILNDRETYFLKSVERQERMNQREVELVHQSVVAELQSKQWDDEGAYLEAMYQEDINYLQNKAALYRKGSEERVEIEDEITEREYQHQLERQQRYAEMVEELRERYLNMGNQRQMEIALNGLEELHRQGRIKEEEYQRARIAIQAQYASAVSPTEQIRQTGSQMLANARNNVNKNAQENKTNYSTPFVGAVQEYQATMEQLRILYANDKENYAAYQYAKQQATAEFCADLVSQFQAAYVKQIKEYHSVKEHHTETDSTAYYKNLFNDAIHELVKERDSKKEVRVTVEKPLAWWQQFQMWSGVASWALAVFAIGLYPAIRKNR